MNTFAQNPTSRTKDVTKEAMALLQEHLGQYQQALDTWENVKSNSSAERTIQILKKSGGSKEWIKHYGKQVFLDKPEIALKLFTNDASENSGAGGMDQGYGADYQESYDSISMTIEEIIDFLGKIEEEAK